MHEKFELQLTAYDLSQARGRLRCQILLLETSIENLLIDYERVVVKL